MKYRVTAMSISRVGKGYKVNQGENDGTNLFYRDEVIDTLTNKLFIGCSNAHQIEDRYEAFWNRLNKGYTNEQIVKVLNVVPESEYVNELPSSTRIENLSLIED